MYVRVLRPHTRPLYHPNVILLLINLCMHKLSKMVHIVLGNYTYSLVLGVTGIVH